MNIIASLPKQQRGVSLVGAIFILVALASVGIAMVTLNSTTTTTSALNVEQSRALYAAKSGMEWAIAIVTSNDQNFVDSCTGVVPGNEWQTTEGYTIKIERCDDVCPACCDATPGACSLNPRMTTIAISARRGLVGDTFYVFRKIQSSISYDGS